MRKAISLLFLVTSVTACVVDGQGDLGADGSVPEVDAMGEDASAPPTDAPPPDAPPGAPTLDVTATPMMINLGGSVTINWISTNTASCTSMGLPQPLNGTFTVYPTVTTTYTVVCTGLNGVGIMDHVEVTVIQPPSPPAPTVDVQATLTTINLGQNTTVTWQSTNAESCTNSETPSQATSGTFTVHPYMTTAYAVVCNGPGGQGQDSVTVTVVPPPPPTLEVTATSTNITVGQSTTVSWNSENATNCWSLNTSGYWVPQPIDGSWPGLMPTTTTTYSLTCYNSSYEVVTDSVTVVVNAAQPPPLPTLTVTASPNTINVGGTTTVTWTSANATGCRSLNSSGNWVNQPTSGSWTNLMPTTTTTYSLTCEGPGGSITRGALVTVNALLTLNFSASPSTIDAGESSCLSWASTNATSCTIESVSKPTSGTMTVSPSSTKTYTAICNGPGGQQITRTATVTVLQPPLPTLSFSATPSTIISGGNSTLSWSTANADTCTATGSWSGSKPVNGTLVVSPTSNAKYQLSCTGPGGTVTKTADVWVNQPANMAPTVSITSPANGATFVTPVNGTITANASDSDGNVTKVEFYANGVLLPSGTDTTAPFSVTLVNQPIPAGSYSLTAKAFDDDNASTVSAAVNVTVTAPQLPDLLLTFTATPLVGGGGYRLEWDSTHADNCTASNAWTGSQSVDGSIIVNPTAIATHTYVLTCTRAAGGSITKSVNISVTAPPANTMCHGSEAFYKNSDLPNIDVCKGWSATGVPQVLPKGNIVSGPDGVCAITCHLANGLTVMPVGGSSIWVPGAVQDSARRYTTGCSLLPGHTGETNPPSGIAWDLQCAASVTVLTGPPNTNL